MLRLTTPRNTLARNRSLTCKETYSGHLKRSCFAEAYSYIQFATKHAIVRLRQNFASTNPIFIQNKPNPQHFPHNHPKNTPQHPFFAFLPSIFPDVHARFFDVFFDMAR
jgi:hypothetical protein